MEQLENFMATQIEALKSGHGFTQEQIEFMAILAIDPKRTVKRGGKFGTEIRTIDIDFNEYEGSGIYAEYTVDLSLKEPVYFLTYLTCLNGEDVNLNTDEVEEFINQVIWETY